MTVEISSFVEALEHARTSAGELSLLLGNGFSQSFSGDFGYAQLRDRATMDDRLTVTQVLFYADVVFSISRLNSSVRALPVL